MKKRNIFLRLISLVLALVTTFCTAAPSFAAPEETPSDGKTEVVESSIPDKIVEIARAQIGMYESNANIFTEWYYGYPTDAYWCTIFVSWCGAQAGATGSAVPKRSTVDGMRQWYIKRGYYYPATSDYVPQKGDIVFMNTALDGTDDVHHVEIITESGFFGTKSNPKIKCIGGNTSNLNYEGSEYVTEKTRPVNGSRAVMVGYAHPPYENCEGLAGILHTLIDSTMPSFIKLIYSKIITLIQILQSPAQTAPSPEVPVE
ncbi:MAG: CHAP domain-containing protein [Clostridia bacterium]|nr:CHAP domain-containing protein [Clostridia bacterium]